MVLSLLNLRLCPTLPTLIYVDLSGSRFLVAPLPGGGVNHRSKLNDLCSSYEQKGIRVFL
jgi:hypothetical protein